MKTKKFKIELTETELTALLSVVSRVHGNMTHEDGLYTTNESLLIAANRNFYLSLGRCLDKLGRA